MSITIWPVVFFWFLQGLRLRDLAFFTAINPNLYMGGMYGTSKDQIHDLLPPSLLPVTRLVEEDDKTTKDILRAMDELRLSFPIILKPDVGERGLNVYKVDNPKQIGGALKAIVGKVLLQEFISYPLEMTVMCYQMPLSGKRAVSSICVKEFLAVTGDGVSTLEELIARNPRAILQIDRIAKIFDMSRVLRQGEKLRLEPIGNHNRGTKFLNGNHLIDERIEGVFLALLEKMEGVHFGRFDIKAMSLESVRSGQQFKIIEFNGVNSEPVHIYDPEYPVWKAYLDWWRQWQVLHQIALEQRRLGVKSQPVGDSWRAFKEYWRYKKRSTSF